MQSPNVDSLRQPLVEFGAAITVVNDTTVDITGVGAATIGELAARHGVVLHELAPQQGSLEEAFLEVTANSQEYRTHSPFAPPQVS